MKLPTGLFLASGALLIATRLSAAILVSVAIAPPELPNTYSATSPGALARPSFNGPGGSQATPTAEEQRIMSAPRYPPVTAQTQHENAAANEKSLLASVNHGRPVMVARPLVTPGARRPASPQPAAHRPPERE
jgi:hypothetical protein